MYAIPPACSILLSLRDHRQLARCLEDGLIFSCHRLPRLLGTVIRDDENPELCLTYGLIDGQPVARGWISEGVIYSVCDERALARYGHTLILHPRDAFPLFLYRGRAEFAAAAALLILRAHEEHLQALPDLSDENAWNGISTNSVRKRLQ